MRGERERERVENIETERNSGKRTREEKRREKGKGIRCGD